MGLTRSFLTEAPLGDKADSALQYCWSNADQEGCEGNHSVRRGKRVNAAAGPAVILLCTSGGVGIRKAVLSFAMCCGNCFVKIEPFSCVT